MFAECQEFVKKDVERAFGVLQARFAIIRGPTRNMDKAELGMIMKACVIHHDVIVEDERDLYDLTFDYNDVEETTRNLMSDGTIICAMHPTFIEYHKFIT